jgi:electron transfer flavoprotein alpha subunit
MGNVLVLIEHSAGQVKKASLCVVTFARAVAAKVGGTVDFLVMGNGASAAAAKVAGYGAGKVHVVEGPAFASYTSQAYAHAIAEVAKAGGYQVVAAAATSIGKESFPRVAVRLNAGMASEVVGLGNGSPVSYVRAMWAGNVMGEVEVATPVHVVTVRSAGFDAAQPAGSASPVAPFSSTFDAAALKQQLVEFRPTVSARPDLTEAKVVISGGRGLKARENFKMLEDLADLLGGAVGATRAAVDSEYIANDYQIGQTGKIVAPDLYMGFGVSGAIQHLAGMKNAKVIVAVNKDEEAPIFSVSDYGLVADLFKVLPELSERLKAVKGK